MSRSRNAYQNIEIAPSSSADVPSQTRWEWIRFSSERHIRIQTAFSGVSHGEELLDREHEHELVRLEGEVVDPLRVRDPLPVGLRLHVLLEAGVQVADHRLEPGDVLPVEVDDQPQDAVRRRVVRAEVDREDVLEVVLRGIDVEDRRAAGGDAGPLVDPALGDYGHYRSPEKRTGSPPSG